MKKASVLIVEDDNIIAQDLKLTLEKLGYEVLDIVASGENAIKRAVELKPDLVMMDIVLRGSIDGIKAAGHILSNYNIPVVYLTSHSDKITIERAKKTGSYGYILKPYSDAELRATLEMVSYKHGMETRLREREHWLDVILSSIGDAVVVADSDGRIKYLNPAAELLTGSSFTLVLGRKPFDVFSIISYSSRETASDLVKSVLEGGSGTVPSDQQMILVTQAGREIPVDMRAYPAKDETGAVTDVVLVLSDVSERLEAVGKLRDSERFLNNIFDSIYDPFCIFDRNFTIVRANQGYAKLKHKNVQELMGNICYEVLEGQKKVCRNCLVAHTLKSGEPAAKEKIISYGEGIPDEWVEIRTYPIFDTEGKVTHVAEYSRIITERKRAEDDRKLLIKELEQLSRTDSLTGLMNRRALIEHLEQEVQRSLRYSKAIALILCDIDNFKDINDSFGHTSGDRALEMVADILRDMARKSDIIGRYGGDEFMIIIPESSLDGAEDFAERIRTTLSRKVFTTEHDKKISISLSFGVSSFNPVMDTPDTFVSRADQALYAAKHAGRNRVAVEKTS